MQNSLVALGVDNTPINALGSFAEGQQAAQVAQNNTLKNAQATLENVGGAAMYALNGDPNGEVDPAKYTEVMDSLGKLGIDVTPYRDNPNFAKIAANASITALDRLKQANNERDYQHTMDEWQHTLSQDTLSNQRADRSLDILSQNADTRAATANATSADGDIPSQIADAIVRGEQPPTTTGLYKYGAAVRAKLAGQGYDLAAAQLDFEATKKHYASMNSTQQLRLEQATSMVEQSLPKVEELADAWNAGGFPTLNSAQLTLALEGALGPEANSIATQLKAQIDDVTSELGTVYKGGNSSTDESLKLAKSQLSADWSEQTLRDAIALIKTNIQYRKNSIAQAKVSGVDNSRYDPNQGNGGGDNSDVTIEDMP